MPSALEYGPVVYPPLLVGPSISCPAFSVSRGYPPSLKHAECALGGSAVRWPCVLRLQRGAVCGDVVDRR